MSAEHAHDEILKGPASGPGKQVQREEANDSAATAAAARSAGSLSRFSAAAIMGLQGSAGSRAVSRALAGGGLAVQRHTEGAELPAVQADAAEVAEKQSKSAAAPASAPAEAAATAGITGPETGPALPTPAPAGPETAPSTSSAPTGPAAPSATRTAAEEKTQKEAGTKSGGDYEKAQKLTPGAQSLASAQAVLQAEYGGIKTFVQGTIEILADQPACSAKYDEVCIRDGVTHEDGSAWKAGDRAKIDAALGVTIEGFAWKGVVYVNGKTTLVTATAHEMLHVNTHADFRGKVGETINEGSTEYFARKALKSSGVTVPATTAYPDQVKIVTDLIALVGEDCLQKAYFTDPDELIKGFEAKGTGTFADLKTAAEALDTAKVADALKPKAAAPAPAPAPAAPAPATPPAAPTPPTGS